MAYAQADSTNVDFDVTTPAVAAFEFNVLYTRDMSGFWRNAIIVLVVFLVLGFIIWLFRSIIYTRNHKNDGTVSLNFLACFCTTFGAVLALVVFIMSFFFLFIFFKWPRTGYICLPPESEFWYITIFVWLGFGLTFVGAVIRIAIQAYKTTFFLDWDNPYKDEVPVSAWRRLMVANCWNMITSVTWKRNHQRLPPLLFTLLILLLLPNMSAFAE